jgi:hypothetical protein
MNRRASGVGMFGKGMGKRPSLDLFPCRTFPWRYFQPCAMGTKVIDRGMFDRGIKKKIFPFPCRIFSKLNDYSLLHCKADFDKQDQVTKR